MYRNSRLNQVDRFEIDCALRAITRAIRFYKHPNDSIPRNMALRHAFRMLNDLRKDR